MQNYNTSNKKEKIYVTLGHIEAQFVKEKTDSLNFIVTKNLSVKTLFKERKDKPYTEIYLRNIYLIKNLYATYTKNSQNSTVKKQFKDGQKI